MTPSLSARVLQSYLRTSLRGRTRLSLAAARWVPSLQAVPVSIADWPPVFLDMRLPGSLRWLQGNPWPESPRERGEQLVMGRAVRNGNLVLDIGANIGLHLALLSRLVGPSGRVMAFEPNSRLLPNLRQTAAVAGNVTLYNIALSDRNDDASLFVPVDHSMASLEDWRHTDGEKEKVACRMRRLDDLDVAGGPAFIKCDVEGAELQVFRGATRLLDQADAPIILYEAGINTARGFGLTQWDATRWLERLRAPRFSFFVVGRDGQIDPLAADIDRNVNVLAVPEARGERMASSPTGGAATLQ